MVIFISGASHTGKTVLAQRLLEKYGYPYLSIDHLKMGLIRSAQTDLTPLSSDDALTDYLWPIVREMAKTAIENHQNLIIEGCYIPSDWQKDFDADYRNDIRCICLVMSSRYIQAHFDVIRAFANTAEQRLDDSGCSVAALIRDNTSFLKKWQNSGSHCILIDQDYETDLQRGLIL